MILSINLKRQKTPNQQIKFFTNNCDGFIFKQSWNKKHNPSWNKRTLYRALENKKWTTLALGKSKRLTNSGKINSFSRIFFLISNLLNYEKVNSPNAKKIGFLENNFLWREPIEILFQNAINLWFEVLHGCLPTPSKKFPILNTLYIGSRFW